MTNALKIIAEERRQDMLHLLWEEERTAGDIARAMPEITFGAVSQHLKVLRDAGFVSVRKQGRSRIYRAQRESLGPLADYLTMMWRGRLDVLVARANAAQKRKDRGEGKEPV